MMAMRSRLRLGDADASDKLEPGHPPLDGKACHDGVGVYREVCLVPQATTRRDAEPAGLQVVSVEVARVFMRRRDQHPWARRTGASANILGPSSYCNPDRLALSSS